MKRIWIITAFIMCACKISCAQHEDYYWVLGQHASLFFNDSSINLPKFERGNFYQLDGANNASICDKQTGELLIYCNGATILNKKGEIMENGDSINPGKYSWKYYPYDNFLYQGSIILPFPNHENQFYVIYCNADSIVPSRYISSHLYYSMVDMNYNNGLGKITEKDKVLLSKLLEGGRINAIQHANGRDWWIIVNGHNDTQHYIFLLNNYGIKLYSSQIIGTRYTEKFQRNDATCVNSKGSQIAYSYSTLDKTHKHRIDFYDFDRCSGLLSNYLMRDLVDTNEIYGLAFSPNDSLCYVSNYFSLYQFNIKSIVDTYKIVIDTYNINIHDPFNVLLGIQKLAPDNKIYMTSWGSCRQLHCITKPNIRGKGCNFVQGYIRTDSTYHYFGDALPNYPNFRLGALKGSECDTIRETPALPVTDELLIYPNPNNGSFKIVNGQSNIKQVEIYSVLGQLVLKQNYNAALAVEINVKELPKAMYIVLVKNSEGAVSKAKLIKQ